MAPSEIPSVLGKNVRLICIGCDGGDGGGSWGVGGGGVSPGLVVTKLAL